MPARKPRPSDEKPQFERFLETARKVGADETDEVLERQIGKIATAPVLDTKDTSAPPPGRSGKPRAS